MYVTVSMIVFAAAWSCREPVRKRHVEYGLYQHIVVVSLRRLAIERSGDGRGARRAGGGEGRRVLR